MSVADVKYVRIQFLPVSFSCYQIGFIQITMSLSLNQAFNLLRSSVFQLTFLDFFFFSVKTSETKDSVTQNSLH